MRILLIALLWSMVVFQPTNCFAQKKGQEAETIITEIDQLPTDLKKISKELDKIDKVISGNTLSFKSSQPYIKTLNAYHDNITGFKVKVTEELNSVTKKITSLASLTTEGETEPVEITKQRQELTKESDNIKAQIASADLALTHIDEINQTIMQLRNQELLGQITVKRESVLNISELWKALVSFSSFVYAVCEYPKVWYDSLSPEQQSGVVYELQQVLTIGFISIVICSLISWFIRRKWGYKKSIEKPTYTQKVFAGFVTLLARGIVPSVLAGAFWLWLKEHEALFSGSFGVILRVGTIYLLYLFLSSAIVYVVFTPKRPQWRLIEVSDEKAISLSFALVFSIVVICLFSYLQVIAVRLEYTDDIIFALKLISNAVKAFCIILVSNRFLYNSQALTEEELQKSLSADTDDAEEIQGLSLSSKISILIGFITLIVFGCSLFGYILLTEYIFNRFISSVLIIGVFYIIQKLLNVLFHQFLSLKFWMKDFRLTKKQTDKAEFWFGLLLSPIIFCICAFVLLALWGVSVDILLSKSKKFLTGFDIGGMHISIVSILLGILFFFVSLFIVKMIKNSLLNGKLSKIEMDSGVRNSLAAGIGFIGIILSCLVGITVMGGSLKGLAIMAGALSLGAGLGLQNVVNNFVSGFILLFERPIKIGDWVVINEFEGTVKQINIRSTVIETFNKANVIIPNADILSNSLINNTYKNKQARVDVFVGVDYASDIAQVKEVLLEIAKNTKNVLSTPAPFVTFVDLADSSLNFRISCYTSDVFNKASISNAIRESIVNRFREEGINIPFPQQVVYLHTEEKPVDVYEKSK